MKQNLMIILIVLHLISSNLFATKSFLDKEHHHSNPHTPMIHQHHHAHHGSTHHHKHSHAQLSMDFFAYTDYVALCSVSNTSQVEIQVSFWISDPALDSLFRPPKISFS